MSPGHVHDTSTTRPVQAELLRLVEAEAGEAAGEAVPEVGSVTSARSAPAARSRRSRSRSRRSGRTAPPPRRRAEMEAWSEGVGITLPWLVGKLPWGALGRAARADERLAAESRLSSTGARDAALQLLPLARLTRARP